MDEEKLGTESTVISCTNDFSNLRHSEFILCHSPRRSTDFKIDTGYDNVSSLQTF